MKTTTPTSLPPRVNSFAEEPDLTKFKPKTATAPKPSKEDIDKISAETGFPSRQAPATKIGRTRRHTTGRNQQLNIKVTAETLKRFYAIADELELPLGEVFQRAVKALEDTQ